MLTGSGAFVQTTFMYPRTQKMDILVIIYLLLENKIERRLRSNWNISYVCWGVCVCSPAAVITASTQPIATVCVPRPILQPTTSVHGYRLGASFTRRSTQLCATASTRSHPRQCCLPKQVQAHRHDRAGPPVRRKTGWFHRCLCSKLNTVLKTFSSSVCPFPSNSFCNNFVIVNMY